MFSFGFIFSGFTIRFSFYDNMGKGSSGARIRITQQTQPFVKAADSPSQSPCALMSLRHVMRNLSGLKLKTIPVYFYLTCVCTQNYYYII